MTSEKEIGQVIALISKEARKFREPIVTAVANETRDPYQVLVGCLLSLRTKDETTAGACERLFRLANTPQQMVKLKQSQIEKAVYPVGFYRVKTRRILDISKTLLNEYKGNVPRTMDELLKLKGVGRKTANIVLTYGFNDPEGLPVDVHCNRIPNRLGWVKTKTPEETEMKLRELIPKKYWLQFNDSFVLFGQNVCKPISPFCSRCIVKNYCKRVGVKKSR